MTLLPLYFFMAFLTGIAYKRGAYIASINERDKNFIKLRETQNALDEAKRRLQIDNDNMNELKKKYKMKDEYLSFLIPLDK